MNQKLNDLNSYTPEPLGPRPDAATDPMGAYEWDQKQAEQSMAAQNAASDSTIPMEDCSKYN